jgi:hypothetical protein
MLEKSGHGRVCVLRTLMHMANVSATPFLVNAAPNAGLLDGYRGGDRKGR